MSTKRLSHAIYLLTVCLCRLMFLSRGYKNIHEIDIHLIWYLFKEEDININLCSAIGVCKKKNLPQTFNCN